MTSTLVHRGPDSAGYWVDEQAGAALGHRRLAIIDLTPEGHQPMHSACGRYVIAFNGEVYNFKALRHELESTSEGHPIIFRGHSDTEVMLAAISRWGLEQALQRFNGMFAFALWDRQERKLHLARDRIGEKPLYYGWVGKHFVFGSELKALWAFPGFKSDIDRGALALYLRHNYIPSPYSIYRGIHKLPAGTMLTVAVSDSNAPLLPKAYWSCREVAEQGVADPFKGTEKEAVDQLDALLRDAVKLRMEADVPLGAFLSGGIDSSIVVGMMQAQSERRVKTFSIGFLEPKYNEAEHAKAVAHHLGTEHTELYITAEEAMAVIPRLATLYDEPFGDPSQIPTFLVSGLARQHVTVSLSGDGGDELFAGYQRYFGSRDYWRRIGPYPAKLRQMIAGGLNAVSPHTWDRVFKLLSGMMPDNIKKYAQAERVNDLAEVLSSENPDAMYRWVMSQWKSPSKIVLGGNELSTVMGDAGQWPDLPEFIERMLYFDSMMYLPDDIMVKLDRASMGVSLEARVPILDHRVVEFAWRVPLTMKIRDKQGKWLLRQVLYKYVPQEMVERPKMGFSVPIDAWLRGGLREWAENLLAEKRLREEGFFDPAPIRKKWLEHLAGTRNWHNELWVILMFQMWLETQ
jgi:asparagine synthase (glutamine-hydrolysing)